MRAGQFAYRRLDQVECLARFERDLDLAALASRQAGGVDLAGDQAHAPHVGERAGDDDGGQHEAAQHEQRVVARMTEKQFVHHDGQHDVAGDPDRGQADDEKYRQDDANSVVLEVRLGSHVLSDAVNAYQYPQDVFLPLGELARLLTLAVRSEPGAGRAGGYVLSEQRTFSVDVLAREVTIEGRREPLDRTQVKLQADDLDVASKLLARWLPVDLKVDLSSLSVEVRPREKLPLESGIDRPERGRRTGTAAYAYDDLHYPRQATRYALASVPFIDQTLRLDLLRTPEGRQADAAYTAYLTADLLGTEAALFASRSARDQDRGTLRLTVGRQDPDAGLLGLLRARTVQADSAQVPGIENISHTSATANGATISNRPLDQPARFDRHSLQGDLPPGSDVELYYNAALVGFQQSRADGKYRFDDPPLAYGPNDFRLVFHGPLSQLRVERRSFPAGAVGGGARQRVLRRQRAPRRVWTPPFHRPLRLGRGELP